MDKIKDFLEKYNYKYEETEIWGRKYYKVYGDEYRDLNMFRYRMECENLDMLICNISSEHYWCVKNK